MTRVRSWCLVPLGSLLLGAGPCDPDPDPNTCPPTAEAECQAQGGVFDLETCQCCRPGPHQLQECELGQGGTFDYRACACVPPAAASCQLASDCAWGMECSGPGATCQESACHEAAPDGSLPARSCPAGEGCEYGDGVDLNHGNGHCVTEPPQP